MDFLYSFIKVLEMSLDKIHKVAETHLEIFNDLESYENRYKFIHLASCIEEFAKYVYLLTLKNCISTHINYFLNIEPFPQPLQTYLKSTLEILEKLYKDHLFKYYLFLSISTIELKDSDFEKLRNDAEKIVNLRNLYLSSMEEEVQ